MDINLNLTIEEIEELQKCSICLNCNHRSIFHDNESSSCLITVCECDRCIVEGETCYWSINRYKYSIYKELLDRATSFTKFSEPRELVELEGKVLKIKKYDRFKLPE